MRRDIKYFVADCPIGSVRHLGRIAEILSDVLNGIDLASGKLEPEDIQVLHTIVLQERARRAALEKDQINLDEIVPDIRKVRKWIRGRKLSNG